MRGGFTDRRDAGQRLARRIAADPAAPAPGADVVVLGLPRGGVPVAAEVARALSAPLDVLLVRKLGVPWQPELAMGAVAETGPAYVDHALVREAGVDDETLARAEARARAELARRARAYRGDRLPPRLTGRDVVIVDDGLATGATAIAACRAAAAGGARRTLLAVPVAPPPAVRRLASEANAVIVVEQPHRFLSVGRFYADFTQVPDEEVVRLLTR